ncbi:MAG: hypothetical protein H0T53_04865 [Herpetosiphonaceae bacterium]|nr:hypothetical protein [Herpetosiphonaceae bacterium]
MTVSSASPAIRRLARSTALTLLLVMLAACQSGSAAQPKAGEPGRAAAIKTNPGQTLLAETMLEDLPIKLQSSAENLECRSPRQTTIKVLTNDALLDPAEVLVIDGIDKYTIVCLAIVDPELQQQITRIVITFANGVTVPVITNGQTAFIVPIEGENKRYESVAFYDQNDVVAYERHCTLRCPK